MTAIAAIYLLLLALVLIAVIWRDHRQGTCELVSVRNVALGGFLIFQLTSGAAALLTGDYGRMYLATPGPTSFRYSLMATVFLVIMLWAYRRGWIAAPLAQRLPSTHAVPPGGSLLVMAVILTILAAALRFGVQIPLVGTIAGYVGTGYAALACGLVGWVWCRRLLNPAMIFFGGLIIAANFAIVMAAVFGRRGLVAIGASLIWGMYYSHWRHLTLRGFLARAAIVGIGPIIVTGVFTSVRHGAEHRRSLGEQIEAMTGGGKIGEGILMLAAGQHASSISMWCIETYPKEYQYRHLMTVWHFLVFPVPRDLWPGKPYTLGELIPKQAAIPKAGRLNLGPGIVGHAAAEGGWYALVVYAVLGGLFLRFFDEIVRRNLHSPLVILAIGCGLGQILGLARGVTSQFAAIYVYTVGGTWLTMVVIGKLMERTGWTRHFGDGSEIEEYGDPEYAGQEPE